MPSELKGTLPNTISTLSKLTSLHINGVDLLTDDSRISGTIPDSIAKCTDLKYLLLPGNRFSGTIPNLAATKLEGLDISLNEMTGNLDNVAALSTLSSIDLSSNVLQGTIPDNMSRMTELETLRLNCNGLSGV